MSDLQPATVRRFGAVQLAVAVGLAFTGTTPAVPLLFGVSGTVGVLTPTWRDSAATASPPVRWWHVASASYLLAWPPALALFYEMGVPRTLFAGIVLLSAAVFLPVAVDLAVGGRYLFPDLREGEPT